MTAAPGYRGPSGGTSDSRPPAATAARTAMRWSHTRRPSPGPILAGHEPGPPLHCRRSLTTKTSGTVVRVPREARLDVHQVCSRDVVAAPPCWAADPRTNVRPQADTAPTHRLVMIQEVCKERGGLTLNAKTSTLAKAQKQTHDRVMPLLGPVSPRKCGQAELYAVGITHSSRPGVRYPPPYIRPRGERREREAKAKAADITEHVCRRDCI